jgi:L,D-peptidoglycan transpeptidase YkuD (ErfK/YbiS/YcfS/YnhG family)
MSLLFILACSQPRAETSAPSTRQPPIASIAERAGPLANSHQVVRVITASWDATDGTLARFERDGTTWSRVGDESAIVVGLKGLGWGRGLIDAPGDVPMKAEGDQRAPAGGFRLPSAFGYAEAPLGTLPYQQSTASHRCVDDGNSAYYNRLVDSDEVVVDWKSAEKMRRSDELYEWGVLVDHNAEAVPGAGSCIFLHVGRPGKGTLGCTAMDADELREVIVWLDPAKEPVLVQLPASVYAEHRAAWDLP